MNDATALRLSLQLLGWRPEDFLDYINSVQEHGGERLVRSTYTRWANGSTPIPAAVKALLRIKLLAKANNPSVEIPRRITVAFLGKGGTGRTANSMFLMALARVLHIPAVYLDPVNGQGLCNETVLPIARDAFPESVFVGTKEALKANIEQACPGSGIVFIDCPANLFTGRESYKALESDLLKTVDYFVITSDASALDLNVARKTATELQHRKARFRVLLCGKVPNVSDIADAYFDLEKKDVPVFSAYVTGTGNSYNERLPRYSKARDLGYLEDEDSAMVDTLSEILDEFDISLERLTKPASESSSFIEVVRATARAKGVPILEAVEQDNPNASSATS